MEKTFNQKKLKSAEWIGFIAVSIMAPLFHFTYEASGFNHFVGMISAVNESVWEHTKILYFPFLFYTVAEYFIFRPDLKKFFAAKSVALAFLPAIIIVFFYTYTGISGMESLAVDIIFAFVWIFLAFLISYRLYKSDYDLNKYFGWFLALFILVFLIQILFTQFAPHLPLFMDSNTGGFGFPSAIVA